MPDSGAMGFSKITSKERIPVEGSLKAAMKDVYRVFIGFNTEGRVSFWCIFYYDYIQEPEGIVVPTRQTATSSPLSPKPTVGPEPLPTHAPSGSFV